MRTLLLDTLLRHKTNPEEMQPSATCVPGWSSHLGNMDEQDLAVYFAAAVHNWMLENSDD